MIVMIAVAHCFTAGHMSRTFVLNFYLTDFQPNENSSLALQIILSMRQA